MHIFYVIGNYHSWIPSVADSFLKPVFRWGFSTNVLWCSFLIFPKLRTCAHHGNPCACHNSKALGHVISLPADSPDRLPWHWQVAELCSKNGCGQQHASHILLNLGGLGHGLAGPKLLGSAVSAFHSWPCREGSAVKLFSRGGKSSNEHKRFSASYKALLIEPVGFQDILLITILLLLHQESGPKAKKFREFSTVCSDGDNSNHVNHVQQPQCCLSVVMAGAWASGNRQVWRGEWLSALKRFLVCNSLCSGLSLSEDCCCHPCDIRSNAQGFFQFHW